MNRSIIRTVAAAALALSALAAGPRHAEAFGCSTCPSYVELPASGSGFYTYSHDNRWGRPEFVYGLINAAAEWQSGAVRPGGFSRIGIGELSMQCGGDIPVHRSHRCGIDVDVRPQSVWGYEGTLTFRSPKYSAAGTNWFIRATAPRHLTWEEVYFNDPALWGAPIKQQEGHDDHWHGRYNRQDKGDCCNKDSGC